MEALGAFAGSVAVGLGQGLGCRESGVQAAGAGPAEQPLWQVGTCSWEEVLQGWGLRSRGCRATGGKESKGPSWSKQVEGERGAPGSSALTQPTTWGPPADTQRILGSGHDHRDFQR